MLARLLRRIVSWSLAMVISAGAAFGAVLIFDRLIASGFQSALPGHDNAYVERTARMLDLYPYSGWHVQANTKAGQLRPDATGLGEPDLGPMGFAVDFDLLNPPAKQPGEFRIVVIGGSGAQGWGAASPDQAMARLLERSLRASGRNVRVINMAMGASITYQNFIALNRFGRKLEPDLVLAYAGTNDFVVPLVHEHMTDVHYQFHQLRALTIAARGSEFPPAIAWLRDLFPNLMTRTQLGYALKVLLYRDWLESRSLELYRAHRGGLPTDPNAFVRDVAAAQMIDALKSIKRDFEGVPIVLIWQAMAPVEIEAQVRFFHGALAADAYQVMYETVRAGVVGYGNDRWHVTDFHSENLKKPHPLMAVHPRGEAQNILAAYVEREIVAAVTRWQLPIGSIDGGR
jgi:hypothetical protein